MPDTTDLIRRARELASLADKATPGPWAAHSFPENTKTKLDRWIAGPLSPDGYADICDIRTGVSRGEDETDANARLIAAAPDMAHLLGQLADELELTRAENARLKGSTFHQCPDCGAARMGED